MKVKWTESIHPNSIPEEYLRDALPLSDNYYEGFVIGTNQSFWGTIYLVVECTDGAVRSVEIDKVKVVMD